MVIRDFNNRDEWRIGTISYIDQRQIKFRAVSSDITDRLLWGQLRHINSLNQYLFAYLNTTEKVIFKVVAIEENEKSYGQNALNKFSDDYVFTATPVGAISYGDYRPGVVDIPMVGSEVYACDEEELNILFNCGKGQTFGRLAGYQNIRPSIQLDGFFGGHTAVLGNTGSGKSTTVRLLLSKLMEDLVNEQTAIKDGALFVVFDLHGDYKDIATNAQIKNKDKVKYYESNTYHLSPGDLNIDDWASILNPSQRIQKPLLERAIRYSCLNDQGKKKLYAALAYQALENTNADGHATRRILVSKYVNKLDPDNLKLHLDESQINAEYKQVSEYKDQTLRDLFNKYNLNYGNLPSGLQEALQICFASVITSDYLNSGQPNIEKVLGNKAFWKDNNEISMDDISSSLDFVFAEEEVRGNKQARSYSEGLVTQLYNLKEKYSENILSTSKYDAVTTALQNRTGCIYFDVSGMPDSDGLKLFSNYVARTLFERNRQSGRCAEQPVYLVFDEAHRYIREHDLADDSIFNQIAREGRKFGVHLMVISQIPNELSKVVLSQTSAFVIHRIQNSIDLDYIKRNVPAISADQVSRLPSFPPGTAVLLGSSFKIPMELEVDGTYKDITPDILMHKV